MQGTANETRVELNINRMWRHFLLDDSDTKICQVFCPPCVITYTNNIHEKLSPFWLAKSSAFFTKTVPKRVNSVQKEVTNQTSCNHQSYSIPILFLLERWIPYFGQSSPIIWNHRTTVCFVFWCAFLKAARCCLSRDIVWCTCTQLSGLYDTFRIFHLLDA